MDRTRVLILPGLYNSGPDHWQSRWEAAHREFRRVMQDVPWNVREMHVRHPDGHVFRIGREIEETE